MSPVNSLNINYVEHVQVRFLLLQHIRVPSDIIPVKQNMDRKVGIIERDKDSHKAQGIDGIVKNKFKWVWLEKTVKVNVVVGGGFKEFPLSEWLRKVDLPHPHLKNLA